MTGAPPVEPRAPGDLRARLASYAKLIRLDRPIGILLGLQGTINPFITHAAFQEIKDKPLAEKVAAMRDPAFRARILDESAARASVIVVALGATDTFLSEGASEDLGAVARLGRSLAWRGSGSSSISASSDEPRSAGAPFDCGIGVGNDA